MKRFRLIIIVTTLLVTLFLSGTGMDSASAGLPAIKHHELKKAYMNGFLAATKINISELEKIKKSDNKELMDVVMKAGKAYMELVEALNENIYAEKN